MRCLVSLPSVDLVFIQKRLFPVALIWLMSRIRKIAFDFDDAIYLLDDLSANPQAARLRYVMRKADLVIAGNVFLADYARAFCPNVRVLPTPVRGLAAGRRAGDAAATVVIGWIGSRNNLKQLQQLELPFSQLAERFGSKVVLKVMSDGEYRHPLLSVENVRWSLTAESQMLSEMDIGIMPLEDNEWTRGKCSFKAILYMSCGVAVVASPVGMNADVVSHGENGFLAERDTEWTDALVKLIESPQLRRSVGCAARQTVQEKYLLEPQADEMVSFLRALND